MVQYPLTLHDIEQKIQRHQYRTAEEFTADFKWILHNCYVYFSCCYTPPAEMGAILKIAKSLLKTCKQEMGQIETCAECYANANSKKNWFVEVCDPPHVLLWAKLKGFPYWPAKAMAVNGATLVDVRFFGAHDRAWVPVKDCYLYSQHNPNVYKLKNTTILQCIKEIEQHIGKVRGKYGGFEYGPAKEKYDPLRHEEQLRAMVPGYKGQGMGETTKTNLTYKIIKTGDNSCLIAPVVKEGSSTVKNGQESAGQESNSSNTKKKKNNSPPSPITHSSSSSSSTGQSNNPTTSTSSTTPPDHSPMIKPTKIVIKNSYNNDKNNKHYELVTPTEEEEDIIATEEKVETNPMKSSSPVVTEETRKVASVVMKRKSDKWRSLSLKKSKTANLDGITSNETKASQDEVKEELETTLNSLSSTESLSNLSSSVAKELKRRNTEEVTTMTSTPIASAVPNKIKIRRVTRASSRPLIEESAKVPEVVTKEAKKDPIINEREKKEEKMSIDVDPEDVDQMETEVTITTQNVTSNKPPITTVRDVLDQLPQISIVPSRKNSICPSGGVTGTGIGSTSSESRVSSRSSSKSRDSNKTSPGKRQQQQSEQAISLSSQLVPENLQVKIEPISDDEVEVTVNGSSNSNNSREKRRTSVEILLEDMMTQERRKSSSKSCSKVVTPTQPRARKTFARNIGSRPKPPAFNPGQGKNMVLIPREGLPVDQVLVPTITTQQAVTVNNSNSNNRGRSASPVHMLSGSITPNLAAAVTNMISHGPPRLVRKPSGTLQSTGDTIFPSEAGSSCRILMENAHRMTDFFRSVIEDTLSDMADKGCLEAKVQLLQLELEKQRYKHEKEVAELKSNTGEQRGDHRRR